MVKRKAFVIGSGFGGLASAIRLQAAGFQTEIFEKRDKPGGRAYVYDDEGFRFDAGPTVVTVPQCLEELFELAGRRMSDYIELIPIHPFYRLFWEDGDTFDYDNDEDALHAELRKRHPDDVAGYKAFVRYAEEVYQQGYVKLGQVPFLRFWDMIKVSPKLLQLHAHRPVYDTISRYIKDERTRQALSFNSLLIGGNPFEISSIYTLIHPLEKKFGVHFPKGGTHALVMALVKLFEDLGGRLHVSRGVSSIVTKNNRVTGIQVEGETVPLEADLVVSNADIYHTYDKLLADNPSARQKASRMSRQDFSMSLFVIYFGCNKRFDRLTHHNIMFGQRYKGLLDDIFKTGRLADDFSLYVHAPGETDTSLAPPGQFGYYVLAPVPNLKISSVDWAKEAPIFADKILNYLEQHYMPGLQASIQVKRLFTPRDFETELNALHGAAFSLTPTLRQSAYFRVHNRDSRIDGMYFVGAGTHPGAGIPGVIGSAKATCSVIDQDYAITGEGVRA
ncbi:MAG TPA: phytoene desaturase [Oligoflexus sp.]|uniref:phytoene desaturase n=1 Tax=Oligoflexus sp. TaxID=1971216 RepID=UPI002D4459CA|nr:phytoene desaturase [Oligoflexus sp.]HYX39723.1 phytoene desaturase [Oligoflexus sp.]